MELFFKESCFNFFLSIKVLQYLNVKFILKQFVLNLFINNKNYYLKKSRDTSVASVYKTASAAVTKLIKYKILKHGTFF